MYSPKSLFTHFIIATCLTHAHAHLTEEDSIRLDQDLLSNYRIKTRPVKNQSEPIEIRTDFMVFSLIKVDNVDQSISVFVNVTTVWFDKNLVWNPSDYNGIRYRFYTEREIWTPKLYFDHSKENQESLFNLPTMHIVDHQGKVTFNSVGILTVFCRLELTFFPFDSQRCFFSMVVIDATTAEIRFDPTPLKRKLSLLVVNNEWSMSSLERVYSEYPSGDHFIPISTFVLSFVRRWSYYVENVVLPTVLLSILSVLTFMVPVESGERLSFSLSTLLSLSVCIANVTSLVPRTSVSSPILLHYLFGLFIICCLCVLYSLMVTSLRWAQVRVTSRGDKVCSVMGFTFSLGQQRKNTALRPRHANRKDSSSQAFGDGGSTTKRGPRPTTSLGGDVRKVDSGNSNGEIKGDAGEKKGKEEVEASRAGGEEDSHQEKCDPDLIQMCARIDKISFAAILLVFISGSVAVVACLVVQ